MRPLLAAVMVLCVAQCATAHAEQRGKVHFLFNPGAPHEQWERRPLPGAYVVLRWTILIPGPGHAVDKCVHSEIARTNDDGEYVMEGPGFLVAGLADASYYAYSPGLQPVPFPYPGSRMTPQDITMTFSTRSAEARLSQISLFTQPGCGGGLSDPHGLLPAYLRALLDEAKALNVDSEIGRREVQTIEAALRGPASLEGPRVVRVVPAPAAGEALQARPPGPGPDAASGTRHPP